MHYERREEETKKQNNSEGKNLNLFQLRKSYSLYLSTSGRVRPNAKLDILI